MPLQLQPLQARISLLPVLVVLIAVKQSLSELIPTKLVETALQTKPAYHQRLP
jgi:hypothetical protein